MQLFICSMDTCTIIENKTSFKKETSNNITKLVWDESKVNIFLDQLMNNNEQLQQLITGSHSNSIHHVVENFACLLKKNALDICGKTYHNKKY